MSTDSDGSDLSFHLNSTYCSSSDSDDDRLASYSRPSDVSWLTLYYRNEYNGYFDVAENDKLI